jgi:hypothetical protein
MTAHVSNIRCGRCTNRIVTALVVPVVVWWYPAFLYVLSADFVLLKPGCLTPDLTYQQVQHSASTPVAHSPFFN